MKAPFKIDDKDIESHIPDTPKNGINISAKGILARFKTTAFTAG